MRQIIVAAIVLSAALGICIQAFAFEKPPTPKTGAWVSDVDENWVEVTISGKPTLLGSRVDPKLIERIFSDPGYGGEIADLAHFACTLYKREGVYLSSSKEYGQTPSGDKGFVVAIRFLFGCAIPASM